MHNLRGTIHGLHGTRTYNIWVGIKTRCQNQNSSGYYKYGARGIKVCKSWQRFENFLADMGPCPSDKHTIDRKNPMGPYSPSNCRWATQREQQNNRANNHVIEFNGERMNLGQWAKRLGRHRNTLMNRINAGLPIETVLSPVRHGRWTAFKKPER